MTMQLESRTTRRAAFGLILGLSLGALSACDSLLEVDLPHLLTDAALGPDGTAETQVNSAIALFECGSSAFANLRSVTRTYWSRLPVPGGICTDSTPTPGAGDCDSASNDRSFFDQIAGARALLTTAPERLVATAEGTGSGVYDRIQDEWNLGQPGERLSAIAAIYVAASLDLFGEFMCEASIDGSDLMTPTDVLDLAEEWITDRALVHIGNFGDFTMPFGIASSATTMAMGLRARIRWANGDLAGAAADAATVPDDFTAWVTRETGSTRRNKTYHSARANGFSGMYGIIDWWLPGIRRPNPVTGVAWPNPIPFTGYIFLGIMPDGRALEAGNLPVRWAEEIRDINDDPIPLGNGAVVDTRVPHIKKPIQGPEPREVPDNYASEDENEPLVLWREMRLIEADFALSQGNLQGVIDIVNALRVFHNLLPISGAYLATLQADADEVRYMLLEERRRELFASSGRYWSTKIQNTDLLWFPRRQGQTPFNTYDLLGGVRLLFDPDTYLLNPHFVERGGNDARTTGLYLVADEPGTRGTLHK